MSLLERLAHVSDEHRRAIGDCAESIRSVSLRDWTVACAEGKWSPAQIAEHLRMAYDPPLAELGGGAGFALRLPWWKRRLLRWKALPLILRGGFPKGAPAPREIRPTSHSATPDEAASLLPRAAEEFLRELAETARRRPVRLTHPYFGGLTALETVTLLTSHARHHQSQLPGQTRDNPRTQKG
jgi:hypothetical protein